MAATHTIREVIQQAEDLFQRGEFFPAAQILSDAIADGPTALLWNDWAAVQVSLGQLRDAEAGFRAALQLDSASTQAMENLGALLFARGCHVEAARHLQQVLPHASGEKHSVIERILAKCSEAAPSAEPAAVSENEPTAAAVAPLSTKRGKSPAWDTQLSYEDWCRSVFREPISVPAFAWWPVGQRTRNGASAPTTRWRRSNANTFLNSSRKFATSRFPATSPNSASLKAGG